jgi:protein O-mannosyl-transferase
VTRNRPKPASTKHARKGRPPQRPPQRSPQRSSERGVPRPRRDWPLWLAGILALTFVVYLPSLDNEFTNWDDNFYVTEFPLVAHPTPMRLLTTPVAGNYHPLTMWSLALNYQFAGLDPAAYHWTSLLIHIANTALVFFFVRRLSRGRRWTPLVTAVLFGIHPMHVESVAWVAERKDVLYAFFYLLGLIAYLRYVDGPGADASGRARRPRVWLIAALAAFVLSAASKPAAVVFPLTLLALDWFRNRRLTKEVLLEKAPFFAVSLIAGILTLQVQRSSGAITEHWNMFEKVMFAAYGSVMYVVKLFVPTGLSAIYPYPPLPPASIGPVYPMAFLAALILFPGLALLFRRNRVVLFGLAFYFINILLVLQFFTIGGATMADRYTYIPYIGLLVALAWWLDEPRERLTRRFPVKAVLAAILVLLIPVSAYATWKRCDVWQNSETLWNDTIAKYPRRIPDAYNNRGYYYSEAGRFGEAVADFDQAIALNPNNAKVWLNKGNALASMGRYPEALVALNRSIAVKDDNADAWNNRGALKLEMGDPAGTIADCSRAIALNPNQRDAYANRSLAHAKLRQYEASIPDSRRAIELAPESPGAYLQYGTLGYSLIELKRHAEAIPAFDEAIRRAPPNESRVGLYYLYRSYARSAVGDKAGALADAQEAARRGAQVPPAHLKGLGA